MAAGEGPACVVVTFVLLVLRLECIGPRGTREWLFRLLLPLLPLLLLLPPVVIMVVLVAALPALLLLLLELLLTAPPPNQLSFEWPDRDLRDT